MIDFEDEMIRLLPKKGKWILGIGKAMILAQDTQGKTIQLSNTFILPH